MNVVIQHAVSQLYLKEGNGWTSELSGAINFGYMEKAALHANEHQLADVHIAVIFPDIGQTFVFPIKPPQGES